MNSTRIKATISIFGETFPSKTLTALLGIEPSACWQKGDIIPNTKELLYRKANEIRLRKESVWEYSTGFIDTVFVEEVISNLDNVLEKREHIKEFVEAHNVNVKIFIVIEILANNKPALYFDSSFLSKIASIDASIDIDMYFLD